jgi:hypothetical protein
MPYWFDGNNLIGQSAQRARSDPKTRRAFLQYLSDLAKSGGGRFTVFFDGDDPERAVPPRGVQVRYCAPLSADETLCRSVEANRTPAEIIVVSNDHELRIRCRDAGSKTLTWNEFTSRKRTPASSDKRHREEKVNVDEWIRYFGLNEGDEP